jgi:hypothetical protein
VRAYLDKSDYERRIEISKRDMSSMRLEPHEILPTWNYTPMAH